MTFVTVRQAFEVSRFADRHGPASVEQLAGGLLLVLVDDQHARRPTAGLTLAADGRVLRVARYRVVAEDA